MVLELYHKDDQVPSSLQKGSKKTGNNLGDILSFWNFGVKTIHFVCFCLLGHIRSQLQYAGSFIVLHGLLSLWHTGLGACGLSCPKACGILVSQPGIKPTSLELEGEFLTTGPPGKSQSLTFLMIHLPNMGSYAGGTFTQSEGKRHE